MTSQAFQPMDNSQKQAIKGNILKDDASFDLEALLGPETPQEEFLETSENEVTPAISSSDEIYTVGNKVHIKESLLEKSLKKAKRYNRLATFFGAQAAGTILSILLFVFLAKDMEPINNPFIGLFCGALMFTPMAVAISFTMGIPPIKSQYEQLNNRALEKTLTKINIDNFLSAKKKPNEEKEIYLSNENRIDGVDLGLTYNSETKEYVVEFKKRNRSTERILDDQVRDFAAG